MKNRSIITSYPRPTITPTYHRKKCFYCEESKCNCEQQELIERHIADDTTEERKCLQCGCSLNTQPNFCNDCWENGID